MTIDYKAFEGATPGPWRVDSRATTRIVAGVNDTVATSGCQGDQRDSWEANARLLAAAHELLSDHKRMSAEIERLRDALTNAAVTIGAIYEWVGRIEKAGGATSISGVAACHAMLKSLRKNADRTDKLIMQPVRAALASSSDQS